MMTFTSAANKKILLAACFLLFLMSSQAFSEVGPLELIKTKDKQLQAMIKVKTKFSRTEEKKVINIINSIFDFKALAMKSAISFKKKMTPAQLKEYQTNFKRMVENASVKKLEVYKSDKTTYLPVEKKSEKKCIVTANIVYKGKKSELKYKLHKTDAGWKAWDLIIDNLSTMRNYRSQFKSIVKKDGISGLLKKIKDAADKHKKDS